MLSESKSPMMPAVFVPTDILSKPRRFTRRRRAQSSVGLSEALRRTIPLQQLRRRPLRHRLWLPLWQKQRRRARWR